jgi:hypothetical protein
MTIEESPGLVISLTENTGTGTLTWDSAAEWDAAASEAGVVHEAYGDLPGADVVQLGYPSTDRGGSALNWFFPFYEDSGTTADDVSPFNTDGDYQGPTLGQTGLHNQDTPSFDGSDDTGEAASGRITDNSSFTLAAWVNYATNPQNKGQDAQLLANEVGGSVSQGFKFEGQSTGDYGFKVQHDDDGSATEVLGGTPASAGTWQSVVGVYDYSVPEQRLFVDGTKVNTVASTADYTDADQYGRNVYYGSYNGGGDYLDGRLAMTRIYDRALSDSEAQAFHNAGTGGHLETATKTFSSSSTPDLQNLSYSLNGQSIDLKVIGSPGTASEEVVTQTLDGSTSYTLTWSNSHTDFRLRPEFSTTDESTSPTFSVGELVS